MGLGNEYLIKAAMALALIAFVFTGVYFQMKANEKKDFKREERKRESVERFGQALIDTCDKLRVSDPRYNAKLAAYMTPKYDDVLTHDIGERKQQIRLKFHDYNRSGFMEEVTVYSETEPKQVVYNQSKDIIKAFMAQYKDMPDFAKMRFGMCVYKDDEGQIIGDFKTLQKID